MSATGRGAERQEHDYYATPANVVKLILPHIRLGDDVLDPCAGDGAILRVLADDLIGCYGIEIDPDRAEAAHATAETVCGDALTMEDGDWNCPTAVVMNPPFSLAEEFIRRALDEVQLGGDVAVLLRLGFLESEGRAEFHKEFPADVFILKNRPSFCAVVKCKDKDKDKCGWKVTIAPDAPRERNCPVCQATTTVVTTDAAAYAWFVFGLGRGNRWWIL